jgi:CheY-like chemotaxis protein
LKPGGWADASGGRLLEIARILIVDDEPFNLDLLEQELELLGYDSVRAVDGRKALERLEAEPFDLVLLDVMMPGIDGYGVLERMKLHTEGDTSPSS